MFNSVRLAKCFQLVLSIILDHLINPKSIEWTSFIEFNHQTPLLIDYPGFLGMVV